MPSSGASQRARLRLRCQLFLLAVVEGGFSTCCLGIRLSGRLAFGGTLLPEDEIHELFAEIRGGMDILASNLDLVQVLQPEHVSAGCSGLGDDPTEEKPQIR